MWLAIRADRVLFALSSTQLYVGPGVPTAFFCNGPQCAATPDAIAQLLDAGYPAHAILYYRGGMHDWLTLGYPTAQGGEPE